MASLSIGLERLLGGMTQIVITERSESLVTISSQAVIAVLVHLLEKLVSEVQVDALMDHLAAK